VPVFRRRIATTVYGRLKDAGFIKKRISYGPGATYTKLNAVAKTEGQLNLPTVSNISTRDFTNTKPDDVSLGGAHLPF